MKNKFKRIIEGMLFIVLISFLCLNVNSEEATTPNDEETANDACEKVNLENAIEAIDDQQQGTITIKIKAGKYKVLITEVDSSEGLGSSLNDPYKLKETKELDATQGKEATYTYSYNSNKTTRIIFVYTGEGCYKYSADIIGKIQAGQSYAEYMITDSNNNPNESYYVIVKSFTNSQANKVNVLNSNYSELCQKFREGIWTDEFENYISKTDFNNYNPMVTGSTGEYIEYIPYCYKQYVEVNYNDTIVKQQIKAAIQTYKFNHKIISYQPVEIPADAKDVTDLNISLTCPATYPNISNPEGEDLIPTSKYSSEYQYLNKNVYKYEKTTSEDISGYTCNKTCTEILTVEYGPPVATKAGLCFEYKVKVTSTVTCNTNENEVKAPDLANYKVCEPSVYCQDTATGKSNISAGPSEEFDSCINECDNGKYTQKCINKCYKKVYGDNSNTLLNYTDSPKVIKLDSEACDSDLNKTDTNSVVGNSTFASNLSSKIISNSGKSCYGRYEKTGDVITWIPGTGHWAQYARFYFLNADLAAQTIRHDRVHAQAKTTDEKDKGGAKRNSDKSVCYGDECPERYYYQPKANGIKEFVYWRYTGSTSTYDGTNSNLHCNWSCQYVGCEKAQYLNEYGENGATTAYQAELDKYTDFINACSAQASCSTTTAEFTIKVNNKTNDNPNVDNWIEYSKATLQNTGSNSVAISDASNIILDRSDCYGDQESTTKYMTEWSFPGTWMNNKTGEISYTPKNSTGWHKKKEKFCTSLNSANVNEDWWYYGFTGEKYNYITKQYVSYDDLNSYINEKDGDYNIKASAKDFGYFSWNVDVSCFYALYSDSGIPIGNRPNGDPGDSYSQIYTIRTVDNSDLFPSTEGEETTDKTTTGRTQGFNWTSNAFNGKNEKYIINPEALLIEIQTKGDSIYDNDDELDYEFYLDSEALKQIRRHTTSGDYTNYTGGFSNENGVMVYNSSLFRVTGKTLDSKYIKSLGTLGCNNQKSGSCYASGIGG